MSSAHIITKIELTSFTITVPNIGTDPAGAGVRYLPGKGEPQTRFALRMHTDSGIVGEYVPNRSRVKAVMGACEFLSHRLIGQSALHREGYCGQDSRAADLRTARRPQDQTPRLRQHSWRRQTAQRTLKQQGLRRFCRALL